jgi:conjugal transfer pilus assembly protein TraV
MNFDKYVKLAALAVTIFLTTACASVGNSEFSCSGIPDDPPCMSTIEVYEATNNHKNLDHLRKSKEGEEEQGFFSTFFSDEESEEPVDLSLLNSVVEMQKRYNTVMPAVHKPIPVVLEPKVLRFTIFEHTTGDGVAHSASRHFVMLKEREFVFDAVDGQKSKVLRPIQVIQNSDPGKSSKSSSGPNGKNASTPASFTNANRDN